MCPRSRHETYYCPKPIARYSRCASCHPRYVAGQLWRITRCTVCTARYSRHATCIGHCLKYEIRRLTACYLMRKAYRSMIARRLRCAARSSISTTGGYSYCSDVLLMSLHAMLHASHAFWESPPASSATVLATLALEMLKLQQLDSPIAQCHAASW